MGAHSVKLITIYFKMDTIRGNRYSPTDFKVSWVIVVYYYGVLYYFPFGPSRMPLISYTLFVVGRQFRGRRTICQRWFWPVHELSCTIR